MSRKKGPPAYPGKSVIGSTYLTKETKRAIKQKAKETGRTASDIMEHALREVLPTLTATSPRIGLDGVFGSETVLKKLEKHLQKAS